MCFSGWSADSSLERCWLHLWDRLCRAKLEAYFDAAQNAMIVRGAEQCYRLMYRESRESWRDRHMFDSLQAVLAHRGAGTKAIIWAQKSHIGNAAATAMGWQVNSI